jgi:hypothetical protein
MTALELRTYLNTLPAEQLTKEVKVLVPASDHSYRVAHADLVRVARYGRTEYSELPLIDGEQGVEIDGLVIQ